MFLLAGIAGMMPVITVELAGLLGDKVAALCWLSGKGYRVLEVIVALIPLW